MAAATRITSSGQVGVRDVGSARERGGLPPGPRAPAMAQTLAWALAPTWLMDRCAKRLGEAFTLTFGPSGLQLVVVSDPEAVKTVFTAPPELSLIHISEPTRRTPISYAVFCLK